MSGGGFFFDHRPREAVSCRLLRIFAPQISRQRVVSHTPHPHTLPSLPFHLLPPVHTAYLECEGDPATWSLMCVPCHQEARNQIVTHPTPWLILQHPT